MFRIELEEIVLNIIWASAVYAGYKFTLAAALSYLN